ncbi:GNAT family N-acetyltransferase [uncultured Desulfobacter sp.]|uniref:GNAT family N-acetyltransferase n=1 Tax=uncultured Desulfobacter sp. TaxID=240139 RepID=UPI002AA7B45E|nr:GNAT family N-acetyltransferase [uncultured Desulfobacter sp.]
MPDLLIKLYELQFEQYRKEHFDCEFKIVRPLSCDKSKVIEFVRREFNESWANECERSFSNVPVSCFIGVKDQKIIGFACYDATAKGFFGPIGIKPEARKKGIATQLLFSCLSDMWDNEYGYAIVGWVDENHIDFYQKNTFATVIPESSPGIYKRMIDMK